MATLNSVPPKLDVVAYGGDDTRITFTLTQDDGESPYVFVGTQKAQMRPDQNSDTYWDLVIEIDEDTDGIAYLTVPSEAAAEAVVDAHEDTIFVGEDLVKAPMFKGVWDWQFVSGDDTRTLVYGDITIIGEVTR